MDIVENGVSNGVCVCAWGLTEKSLWDLQAVIIKSNDDVRQEVFIMQLISFFEVRHKTMRQAAGRVQKLACRVLPSTHPPE